MIQTIRHTRIEELQAVMEIYATARQFMRQSGNPNQWSDNYPSTEDIEDDIRLGRSYVCINSDNEIAAVFFFQKEEPDPTYHRIEGGTWLNENPYGVIHRIASSGRTRGVMRAVVNWCFSQINNLRIDTHRDNRVMQQALLQLNFQYCGIIYLQNGGERLAYQKTE